MFQQIGVLAFAVSHGNAVLPALITCQPFEIYQS